MDVGDGLIGVTEREREREGGGGVKVYLRRIKKIAKYIYIKLFRILIRLLCTFIE